MRPNPIKVGDKLNKLTVIEFCKKNERNETIWKCLCDCGKYKEVKTANLVANLVKSCGCIKTGPPRKYNFKVGDKLHDIEIIKIERHEEYRCNNYTCKCQCGEIYTVLKHPSKRCQSCANKFKFHKEDYLLYKDVPFRYFDRLKKDYSLRGFEFSLTIEYLSDLFLKQKKKCIYTKLPIDFSKRNGGVNTASLDRIDSTKGYVVGNVQWVHKHINKMKQEFSDEYFIKMCSLVKDNHGINATE